MKKLRIVISLLAICGIVNGVSAEENTPNVKSGSGAVIEVVETEIDLGIIQQEQNEIIGEIFFLNSGDKPLLIRKVTGPCACFAGYSGDKFLQPEDGGVLEVKFDKSKIPAGDVKRLAVIETNDPKNEKVKVYFSFHVERDPRDEEIRILKNELSAIRKDVQVIRRDIAKVLAAISNDKPVPKKKPVDTTVYDIAVGSSPILGAKDAPVTITVFADFQCPYSVREYPKLKEVAQKYPDKVKVIFKHFPLHFHKKARPAHAAAELAKTQGGSELFWKMHDMIIAEPKKLDISDFRQYAQTLNMDLAQFDDTMADGAKIDLLLKSDLTEAKKCKVRGTPSVFINGLKLADRSIAGYSSRIDSILKNPK